MIPEAKINKSDYIKFKSFCITKEAISEMKRQPMEWENVFINHIPDKGLISRVYKELLQLNNNKNQ